MVNNLIFYRLMSLDTAFIRWTNLKVMHKNLCIFGDYCIIMRKYGWKIL